MKQKKIVFSLLLILIFFVFNFVLVSFSSNKISEESTEQTVNVQEQVEKAITFNNKDKIAKLKETHGIKIKNKAIDKYDISSQDDVLNLLPDNNYVLWNKYFSYYRTEEEIAQDRGMYTVNSFLFIYSAKTIREEYLENITEMNMFFSFNERENVVLFQKDSNFENYFTFLKINTQSDFFNYLINNHIFIINLNFEIRKNITNNYIFDQDSFQFEIEAYNHNFYIELSNFSFTDRSFNLSYYDDFYNKNPKINFTNFILYGDGLGTFTANILVPNNTTINDVLKNLKFKADYRSYNNYIYDNNCELSIKEMSEPYKYGYSSWYNVSFSIENLKKEGGYIYYNFSFFYKGEEFFLKSWFNDFKIMTPYNTPKIENIYARQIDSDSYYIDIKYDDVKSYEQINNLILKTKRNNAYETIILKNPRLLDSNFYEYRIDNLETGLYRNFVFLNSGYFNYDILTNSFYKSYDKNLNFVNYNSNLYFKIVNIDSHTDNENPIILSSKIFETNNNYFINVSYYVPNKILLLNMLQIKLAYWTGEDFNSLVYKTQIYRIDNFKNDGNNIITITYSLNDIQQGYIYKDIAINLDQNSNDYNNAYVLPRKYYISDFNNENSELKNINLESIDNNSIAFNITFQNVSKLQAENLKITFRDSDSNHNTLEDGSLIFNKIVYKNSEENIATYQYSLTNLKSNETYSDFNFFYLENINYKIGNRQDFVYSSNSFYSSSNSIKTKRVSNHITTILLISLISIIYLTIVSFFILKLVLYFKSKI